MLGSFCRETSSFHSINHPIPKFRPTQATRGEVFLHFSKSQIVLGQEEAAEELRVQRSRGLLGASMVSVPASHKTSSGLLGQLPPDCLEKFPQEFWRGSARFPGRCCGCSELSWHWEFITSLSQSLPSPLPSFLMDSNSHGNISPGSAVRILLCIQPSEMETIPLNLAAEQFLRLLHH